MDCNDLQQLRDEVFHAARVRVEGDFGSYCMEALDELALPELEAAWKAGDTPLVGKIVMDAISEYSCLCECMLRNIDWSDLNDDRD